MSIKELLKSKREEIFKLAEKYGVYDVRIFGSVARGEDNEKSDIDLLIKRKPGFSLLKHAAFNRELIEILGIPVDVASENGLKERIKDRVLKEAIPL
jgi:predicted nucleotidyltransferase